MAFTAVLRCTGEVKVQYNTKHHTRLLCFTNKVKPQLRTRGLSAVGC